MTPPPRRGKGRRFSDATHAIWLKLFDEKTDKDKLPPSTDPNLLSLLQQQPLDGISKSLLTAQTTEPISDDDYLANVLRFKNEFTIPQLDLVTYILSHNSLIENKNKESSVLMTKLYRIICQYFFQYSLNHLSLHSNYNFFNLENLIIPKFALTLRPTYVDEIFKIISPFFTQLPEHLEYLLQNNSSEDIKLYITNLILMMTSTFNENMHPLIQEGITRAAICCYKLLSSYVSKLKVTKFELTLLQSLLDFLGGTVCQDHGNAIEIFEDVIQPALASLEMYTRNDQKDSAYVNYGVTVLISAQRLIISSEEMASIVAESPCISTPFDFALWAASGISFDIDPLYQYNPMTPEVRSPSFSFKDHQNKTEMHRFPPTSPPSISGPQIPDDIAVCISSFSAAVVGLWRGPGPERIFTYALHQIEEQIAEEAGEVTAAAAVVVVASTIRRLPLMAIATLSELSTAFGVMFHSFIFGLMKVSVKGLSAIAFARRTVYEASKRLFPHSKKLAKTILTHLVTQMAMAPQYIRSEIICLFASLVTLKPEHFAEIENVKNWANFVVGYGIQLQEENNDGESIDVFLSLIYEMATSESLSMLIEGSEIFMRFFVHCMMDPSLNFFFVELATEMLSKKKAPLEKFFHAVGVAVDKSVLYSDEKRWLNFIGQLIADLQPIFSAKIQNGSLEPDSSLKDLILKFSKLLKSCGDNLTVLMPILLCVATITKNSVEMKKVVKPIWNTENGIVSKQNPDDEFLKLINCIIYESNTETYIRCPDALKFALLALNGGEAVKQVINKLQQAMIDHPLNVAIIATEGITLEEPARNYAKGISAMILKSFATRSVFNSIKSVYCDTPETLIDIVSEAAEPSLIYPSSVLYITGPNCEIHLPSVKEVSKSYSLKIFFADAAKGKILKINSIGNTSLELVFGKIVKGITRTDESFSSVELFTVENYNDIILFVTLMENSVTVSINDKKASIDLPILSLEDLDVVVGGGSSALITEISVFIDESEEPTFTFSPKWATSRGIVSTGGNVIASVTGSLIPNSNTLANQFVPLHIFSDLSRLVENEKCAIKLLAAICSLLKSTETQSAITPKIIDLALCAFFSMKRSCFTAKFLESVFSTWQHFVPSMHEILIKKGWLNFGFWATMESESVQHFFSVIFPEVYIDNAELFSKLTSTKELVDCALIAHSSVSAPIVKAIAVNLGFKVKKENSFEEFAEVVRALSTDNNIVALEMVKQIVTMDRKCLDILSSVEGVVLHMVRVLSTALFFPELEELSNRALEHPDIPLLFDAAMAASHTVSDSEFSNFITAASRLEKINTAFRLHWGVLACLRFGLFSHHDIALFVAKIIPSNSFTPFSEIIYKISEGKDATRLLSCVINNIIVNATKANVFNSRIAFDAFRFLYIRPKFEIESGNYSVTPLTTILNVIEKFNSIDTKIEYEFGIKANEYSWDDIETARSLLTYLMKMPDDVKQEQLYITETISLSVTTVYSIVVSTVCHYDRQEWIHAIRFFDHYYDDVSISYFLSKIYEAIGSDEILRAHFFTFIEDSSANLEKIFGMLPIEFFGDDGKDFMKNGPDEICIYVDRLIEIYTRVETKSQMNFKLKTIPDPVKTSVDRTITTRRLLRDKFMITNRYRDISMEDNIVLFNCVFMPIAFGTLPVIFIECDDDDAIGVDILIQGKHLRTCIWIEEDSIEVGGYLLKFDDIAYLIERNPLSYDIFTMSNFSFIMNFRAENKEFQIFVEKSQRKVVLDPAAIIEQWITGELGAHQFLHMINIACNRSYNTLDNYPVFPRLGRDLEHPLRTMDPEEILKMRALQSIPSNTEFTPEFYSINDVSTTFQKCCTMRLARELDGVEVSRTIHKWVFKILGVFAPPKVVYSPVLHQQFNQRSKLTAQKFGILGGSIIAIKLGSSLNGFCQEGYFVQMQVNNEGKLRTPGVPNRIPVNIPMTATKFVFDNEGRAFAGGLFIQGIVMLNPVNGRVTNQTLPVPSGVIAMDSTGNYVVGCSSQKTVWSLNTSSEDITETGTKSDLIAVAALDEINMMVVLDADNTVTAYTLDRLTPEFQFSVEANRMKATDISLLGSAASVVAYSHLGRKTELRSFTSSGKRLCSFSHNSVLLHMLTFSLGPLDEIIFVTFDSLDSFLISASTFEVVRQFRTAKPITAVCYDSKSRTLALSGGAGEVLLFMF